MNYREGLPDETRNERLRAVFDLMIKTAKFEETVTMFGDIPWGSTAPFGKETLDSFMAKSLSSRYSQIGTEIRELGGITLMASTSSGLPPQPVQLVGWSGPMPMRPDLHIWEVNGNPRQLIELPGNFIDTLLAQLDDTTESLN